MRVVTANTLTKVHITNVANLLLSGFAIKSGAIGANTSRPIAMLLQEDHHQQTLSLRSITSSKNSRAAHYEDSAKHRDSKVSRQPTY